MEPVNFVYEDHHVVCILDIAPFNDGHLLIMPRQHYLDIDEIDEDTRNAVIPRYLGDGFSWSEPKDEFKTTRTLSEIKTLLTDNLE